MFLDLAFLLMLQLLELDLLLLTQIITGMLKLLLIALHIIALNCNF